MPGAYAHITLASSLVNKQELKARDNLDQRARKAVRLYGEYMILGCMSPDFPYLAITDFSSSEWADLMHVNSGAMLKHGIDLLKDYDGSDRRKGLAWLMGYAAHVGGDLTIHPVLSLNGCNYETHPAEHRTCEMHQDAFIFPRLNLGGIGLAEYMPKVVGACRDHEDEDEIDPIIEQIWRHMLERSFPTEYQANKPDIDIWFSQFKGIVDKIAGAGNHLFDWGRQIAAAKGFVYPDQHQIDRARYISSLTTPDGTDRHYEDLFEMARQNTYDIWDIISAGLFGPNAPGAGTHHSKIKDWNLDTGLDGAGTDAKSVYW